MRQQVQMTPLWLGVSGPVACVENRRWSVRGATFVTLNVAGSCNNLIVNARSREVFAYQPQIVPLNPTAVAAP